MNFISKKYATYGAMITLGMMQTTEAMATGTGTGGGSSLSSLTTTKYTDNSFSEIFERISVNLGGITGMISLGCYLVGIVLAIIGVMKVKEHVESPDKEPLKNGVIRLVVGGALLALPALINALTLMIMDSDAQAAQINLKKATFGLN